VSAVLPADGALLECRGVAAGYGAVAVVRNLDLRVEPGEVVALIGPNGAGKTTTLLTIAGELPVIAGEVVFLGTPTKAPLFRRARRGMGFVTEERSVFMALSAEENLRIAGVSRAAAVGVFPELEPLMGRTAGLLSGGEQQMLTLARAVARAPQLLLADELSLGLAPLVVDRLLQAVRRAADEQQTAVIMVEQHAHKALKYTDHAIVIRRGRVSLDLTGEQARTRIGEVEQAYLTSSGGDILKGDAELAAEHNSQPG
jgi:branched-chain amino acid transport system ATP-binding protein